MFIFTALNRLSTFVTLVDLLKPSNCYLAHINPAWHYVVAFPSQPTHDDNTKYNMMLYSLLVKSASELLVMLYCLLKYVTFCWVNHFDKIVS